MVCFFSFCKEHSATVCQRLLLLRQHSNSRSRLPALRRHLVLRPTLCKLRPQGNPKALPEVGEIHNPFRKFWLYHRVPSHFNMPVKAWWELRGKHLNRLSEPPRLTALDAEEQQLNSRTEIPLQQVQDLQEPRGDQRFLTWGSWLRCFLPQTLERVHKVTQWPINSTRACLELTHTISGPCVCVCKRGALSQLRQPVVSWADEPGFYFGCSNLSQRWSHRTGSPAQNPNQGFTFKIRWNSVLRQFLFSILIISSCVTSDPALSLHVVVNTSTIRVKLMFHRDTDTQALAPS